MMTAGLLLAGCSSDRGGSGYHNTYNTGWGVSAPVDRRDVRDGATSTTGAPPSPGTSTGADRVESMQPNNIGGSDLPGDSSSGSSYDPASNTNNVNDTLSGDDPAPQQNDLQLR